MRVPRPSHLPTNIAILTGLQTADNLTAVFMGLQTADNLTAVFMGLSQVEASLSSLRSHLACIRLFKYNPSTDYLYDVSGKHRTSLA